MCKFAEKCEIYDAEFCSTVLGPPEEWPCYGTGGLSGQISPTEDYLRLVRNKLEAKKLLLGKAGFRVFYAKGHEVHLLNDCNFVCGSYCFDDCNDDRAVYEWLCVFCEDNVE